MFVITYYGVVDSLSIRGWYLVIFLGLLLKKSQAAGAAAPAAGRHSNNLLANNTLV